METNEGGGAKVLFRRHAMCESCGQCRGPRDNVREVANPLGAKEGDWVLVALEEGNLVKAALLIYLVPLLALIGGFLLGSLFFTSELVNMGLGLLAMASVFFFIKLHDRTLAKKGKFRPVIIRLAQEEEIPQARENVQNESKN